MSRLAGKTALITGAARGLGAAIAKSFVDEGAVVIINDLALEAAQRTAAGLGGNAVACDVSNSSSVTKMFADLEAQGIQVDILVNNAGISGLEGDNNARARIARMAENAMASSNIEGTDNDAEVETLDGGITDVSDEAWQRMIGVHLNGTFFCSRQAVEMMRKNNSAGCIINMGSIMGTFGRPGGTAYCAAKAGILGFTRALAHELAAANIRVNAIAPGWIHTDMTDPLEPLHELLKAQTPLGRLGDTDDIAYAAVYLASEEAKFMTGQTLSPNGGWYMSQ